MSNAKLILMFLVYMLLHIPLQLKAIGASSRTGSNTKSFMTQKDSVKLSLYKVNNKDLVFIIDSFIAKWEKSPCYEPFYLNLLTFPMEKETKSFVKDVNRCDCWEISVKAFNYDDLRSSTVWGCFEYKKRFFILSGFPCRDIFSSQNTKQVLIYHPINNREKYAYNTIMSWTYNYLDNHFILKYKK